MATRSSGCSAPTKVRTAFLMAPSSMKVLWLMSMRKTTLRGTSSRAQLMISCSTPSSNRWKSLRARSVTGSPA